MHRDSLARGLFSGLLFKMAQRLPPNERLAPKRLTQGRPALKQDLSDDQIEECRRAHEAGEKTCKQLAEEHGIDRRRMYAILTYQTRSARVDVRQPA